MGHDTDTRSQYEVDAEERQMESDREFLERLEHDAKAFDKASPLINATLTVGSYHRLLRLARNGEAAEGLVEDINLWLGDARRLKDVFPIVNIEHLEKALTKYQEAIKESKEVISCWCGRLLENSLPPGRRICPSHIDDWKQPVTPRYYDVCPKDGTPLKGSPDGDGWCDKCHYHGNGVKGAKIHHHHCRCIECKPALHHKE